MTARRTTDHIDPWGHFHDIYDWTDDHLAFVLHAHLEAREGLELALASRSFRRANGRRDSKESIADVLERLRPRVWALMDETERRAAS
jgi:hypothetical protein